jgi:hypothetical protein
MSEFESLQNQEFTPRRADRLWGPPSLQSGGYRPGGGGYFPGIKPFTSTSAEVKYIRSPIRLHDVVFN